ncbi:TRAP transporter small permease [Rhodovulum strictum]|uniref:TRAP transporter small permease protein n=1 Tax=Rhodovulum strictum TaxID=58314 RepID=A0A844BI04_9RHOB|nr:TRAP transporter small permease [Rhodovulum strictum]MRH20682.1 TRAP transporter small permease subunit [Rhodovulum strictum]
MDRRDPLYHAAQPPLRRGLAFLCSLSAALGGAAIFAVSLAVTASVVMRNLGLGGIRGDFELTEIVCATCASLFLPLCQLRRGHVLVDLFTAWLPRHSRLQLDGLWTALFALAWAFLCWRLCHGMIEMRAYGDRTMLLGVPVWWVWLPAILGTGLSALVALDSAAALLRGREPDAEWP